MGISISPASWILNLSKNNKERDLKIAEYLDQIAEEANILAKIWENIASSVLTNGEVDAESNSVWIRLVERPEWTIYSKNIPRSRLEIFYDRLSSVLGKSHRGELDFLICKIGAILQKKKLTKDMIEYDLKRIKEVRFFDKNNQIKDGLTIEGSITLLNREAAALNDFAKDFRTKI
ncbi:MAG TPA: hypothetical protein VM012_01455 [Flavitalea sp.]|nr:hypothetical protein [Flavitalea sp.]